MAGGLPDGAPRPPCEAVDFDAIRGALASLDAGALSEVQGVVLLAWLSAFHDCWPSRFEEELGPTGAALREALGRRSFDPNRYIKLRRIAAENLATAL